MTQKVRSNVGDLSLDGEKTSDVIQFLRHLEIDNPTLELSIEQNGYDDCTFSVIGERPMTSEEVQQQIEGVIKLKESLIEVRRKRYEELKKEFGT